MATVNAFLSIELSLAQRLDEVYQREVGRPLGQKLAAAANAEDFDEISRLTELVTFDPVTKLLPEVEMFANSAFLLGASFWTGSVQAASVALANETPLEVKTASVGLLEGLCGSSAPLIRNQLTAETQKEQAGQVAEEQAIALTSPGAIVPVGFESVLTSKADEAALATRLNRAVRLGGRQFSAIGANLTTGRLAAFGGLVAAQQQGFQRYQINEVLDTRICPVCRRMHGRVFTVDLNLQQVGQQLLMNPLEMKAGFPFTSSTRAGIDELTSLDSPGLFDKGWQKPPFHPFCRGTVVPVGTVSSSEMVPFTPLLANETIRQQTIGSLTGTKPPPAPKPKPKTSMDANTTSTGAWTPDRRLLQEEDVFDPMFANTASVQAGQRPVMQLTGGGSASGKGAMIEQGVVKLPPRQVFIDADQIKARLPEFRAMTAAGDARAASFTHVESSLLSEEAMIRASARRINMTLDGTGNGDITKLRRRLLPIREAGYEIRADYVYVPTETALSRAAIRAESTGRLVPEAAIRSTHVGVSKTVPKALDEGLFDEFRLWDNSGDKVRLIASQSRGQPLQVLDQTLWDDFLAKANEPIVP